MAWLRRILRSLLAFHRQLVMPPPVWGLGVSRAVSPDGFLSPDSPADTADWVKPPSEESPAEPRLGGPETDS